MVAAKGKRLDSTPSIALVDVFGVARLPRVGDDPFSARRVSPRFLDTEVIVGLEDDGQRMSPYLDLGGFDLIAEGCSGSLESGDFRLERAASL